MKEQTTVTPSGRTTVSLNVEANGSGLFVVKRDGMTIHVFQIPPEQPPVDG